RNRSIVTNFASTGGRYTRGEFSTVRVKGLNVPPFWQLQVPAANGGTRPVDALLDNFMSIQGVNAGVEGHETCQRLHWQPVPGQQSRAEMAADGSDAPMSAVNMDAITFAFKSDLDKSFVPLVFEDQNPLTVLLRPFLDRYPVANATLQSRLTAAGSALDALAESWTPAARETRTNQNDAMVLLDRDFGDLNAIFQQRVVVYRSLIARSLSNNLVLPGFTDLPVGQTGSRDALYNVNGNIIETPDMRDMFGAQATIFGLAEKMVVVEYLLREDLCRSIVLGARSMSGLTGAQNPVAEQDFDEHTTGMMASLIFNAKYYVALSACLLELIDQLKAANIFDDTVIEVGGEFGRTAIPDGSGSDHGWSGKNMSYYSGRFKGPTVLGNVYSTPPNNSGLEGYLGTWGHGAPVEGAGSTLSLNHETASLATMLGVPSPTNAVDSLLTVDGDGRIVPAASVERARIIRAA
ncbi:MAG: hypothetical protein AAFV29_04770, partial [Myxococcota bacterium]